MVSSMWDDDIPLGYRLQQDLWSAAYNLDVAGVKKALADGAPPEPQIPNESHGRKSPLLRVLESPFTYTRDGQKRSREIVQLLLDAHQAHPDMPPPASVLAYALEKADRWVLDSILPFYPEGIDTFLPLSSSRALNYAIEKLTNQESYPAGRMTGPELFDWVLSKNPSLAVSDAVLYTQWLEPLPFALQKFSQSSGPGQVQSANREKYKAAVDALVERGAPVWIEGADQSWSAASTIIQSKEPKWLAHLMVNLPRQHWDEMESRLKQEKDKAQFRKMRMEAGMDTAPAPASPDGPRFRF